MKKKIKTIITLSFLILWISAIYWADNKYYEYAEIPWTDIIELNSQVNGKIYKVYIDTWSINYVTWSDDKLHSCFSIMGTWYTEKLWEIYFQYYNKWSYVCSDNKLRWVFKIWAWWRWNMEDLENSREKWKLFVDKIQTNWTYYHSIDANKNPTWQAFLDGIWFSNWNNVRTNLNIQQAFSNMEAQIVFNWTWKNANGYDTWTFIMILKYKNKLLKNFKVDSISFITWYNSDVKKNLDTIAWYKYSWNLITDDNWNINWQAVAYIWGNRTYWIKIKIQDNEIIKTWNVNFNYPFNLNLGITWDEIAWKKLIWYNNKSIISIQNINVSNLTLNNIYWSINLWTYSRYFDIQMWDMIDSLNTFNLKIIPKSSLFYAKDFLEVKYNITWNYTYKIRSDNYTINNFNIQTNNDKIYKYWKIENINIVKEDSTPIADWKEILWYDVKFLDKYNYPINNINFNVNIKDINKSFDLNEQTNTYETWFFITTNDTLANIDGSYKIWIISYKPANNTYLSWFIQNIIYSWEYTISSANKQIKLENIYFKAPVWINFENKILKANEKDNFKVNYTKNVSNVSNPSYNFNWYIQWCSDCTFSWNMWKYINDNNFQEKTFNIYINWSYAPDAVIYSWYYSYNLNWDYWNKFIKNFFEKIYSPIIYVNIWAIKIIWIAWSDTKIIWWVNYISTSLEPYIIKNAIKKYIINSTMWYKKENINLNTNINLSNINKINIYKCWNNEMLNINWHYTWNKQIISLWCEININSNIMWDKGNLQIFSYNDDDQYNFSDINWWKNKWNIYIKNNVDTIQASLYTNGSIFTYIDDINNWIFTWKYLNWFKKQLYIKWKVFSKNTLWGWTQDKNLKFTILWWKKINNYDNIFWKKWYIAAQVYDINFWRTSLLNADNKIYSTWDLSEIIYNKYKCTWNKDTDKNDICSTSIIIEDIVDYNSNPHNNF